MPPAALSLRGRRGAASTEHWPPALSFSGASALLHTQELLFPFGDQPCVSLGNVSQVEGDVTPSAAHSLTFTKGESTFQGGFPEVRPQ